MKDNNKIRIAVILICLLTIGGEIFLLKQNSSQSWRSVSVPNSELLADVTSTTTKQISLSLSPNQITAHSAIVVDLNTGKILFAKDKDKPMPLASITKIMTVLVAAKQTGANNIVKLTPEDLGQDGDSGLTAGEKWRLKDLINFTLVSSSNDGAAAIAAAVTKPNNDVQFSDLMNAEAARIGMTNTHFINETGLDISKDYGGSYGSAADVAKMFAYALKSYPGVVSDSTKPAATYTSVDKNRHTVINTNKIAGRLPGLRVSKTGYTDIADGNLAVVIDAGLNQPYAVVVLGATQDGRFQDVDKLVKAIYQAINKPV